MNSKLVNIWVILGAIIVTGVLIFVLWMLLKASKPEKKLSAPATAVLNVISAPTITATVQTPTETPTGSDESDLLPSPIPGNLSIGESVQINGTGGDGLRLRASPGLQGDVLFLGYEGEVFQVVQGPHSSDGYVWWYLVAPYDEKVQGWAVSNYLAVLQNP
jgi:hypothetical protein